MKKVWIAICSIFILFAGVAFTACGESQISLTLSSAYEEICINAGTYFDTPTVEAKVSGVKDGRVSAYSTEPSVVTVSVEPVLNSGKNIITLSVPSKDGKPNPTEGNAQVIVSSRDDPSIKQTINVCVYSDVLGMTMQSTGFSDGQDPRFCVRGGMVELDASKLVSFTDGTRDKARKDIVWSFSNERADMTTNTEGSAQISGNALTLNDDFAGIFKNGVEYISVYAHSVYNPSIVAEISLAVLEKIEEDAFTVEFSNYRASTDYVDSSEAPDGLRIVPNIDLVDDSLNNQVRGYIRVKLNSETPVEITPIISSNTYFTGPNGRRYDIISVLPDPSDQDGDWTYYEVRAISYYVDQKGVTHYNPSVNGTCVVNFKLKYADYAYSESVGDLKVSCYEKINNLNVKDKNGNDITLSGGHVTQNIYTTYQNFYGEPYTIEVLPKTVIDKTEQFYFEVTYQPGTIFQTDAEGKSLPYLQFYYKRGNDYVSIPTIQKGDSLTYVIGNATDGEINTFIPVGVNQIFVRAVNFSPIVNQVNNVEVKFISYDNPQVSEIVMMNLYRSTQNFDFQAVGEDDVNVVHQTGDVGQLEFEKTLVLQGQQTIQGLSVVSGGEAFYVSQPYDAVAGDNSVTFKIKFTITKVGATELGWYQILHENGFESDKYSVDLFLPLTNVDVTLGQGQDGQNINNIKYGGQLFVDGELGLEPVSMTTLSLWSILLSTPTSVSLEFLPNRVAYDGTFSDYAQASVEFFYLDKNQDNSALFVDELTSAVAADIYNQKLGVSSIVAIRDGVLSTYNRAGMAYVIACFTGRDDSGQALTLVRIFKVEAHIALSGLSAADSEGNKISTLNVYAADSVSQQDLSQKQITISFGDVAEGVTYAEFERFSFNSSRMSNDDQQIVSRNQVHDIYWTDGNYYFISDVVISGKNMTFTLCGRTTDGANLRSDTLTISYSFNNIFRSLTLEVNVLSAERVEKISWLNQSEQGLYFNVYDTTKPQQVIATRVDSASAYNKQLVCFVFDLSGNLTDQLVEVEEIGGQFFVSDLGKAGAGYIVILPADAVNNGQIFYRYHQGEQTNERVILTSALGQEYQNIVQNGFFLSNDGDEVPFSQIVFRVPFTIADGSSWDTAFRLYDEGDFKNLNSNSYYYVMSSVTLSGWGSGENSFSDNNNLYGGIAGFSQNISITLTDSASFVDTLGRAGQNVGQIKNLTFSGAVSGDGFVANKNYGTISDVTVDVFNTTRLIDDKTTPIVVASSVTGDDYAGAIVGQNYGLLQRVSAFGVNVSGRVVGGFAGFNSGNIEDGIFEIYNFADGANTLSGTAFVGGFVGEAEGGQILRSYAYDYTLSAAGANLKGEGKIGAFVGNVKAGDEDEAKIVKLEQSFAVVGVNNICGQGLNENIDFTDYYNSYYVESEGEDDVYTVDAIQTKPENWIPDTDDEFLSWVNGGKAYLRALHQDQPLLAGQVEDAFIKTNVLDGRFYQTLNVATDEALLFYYDVFGAMLSSSEQNALSRLNTISFDVFNADEQISDRISVLSSDVNILQVLPNQLLIKGTGKVTLTISSKQDYSQSSQIEVTIIRPLSQMLASKYTYAGQSALENNSEVEIQRQTNLQVVYTLENENIYLGTEGNRFDVMLDENLKYMLDVAKVEAEETQTKPSVSLESNVLSFASDQNSWESTQISVTLNDSALSGAQNGAIANEFNHKFVAKLINGAIRLDLAPGVLPISPSKTGEVRVELESNNPSDTISVNIGLVLSDTEVIELAKTGGAIATYSLDGQERIKVTIEDDGTSTDGRVKKFVAKFEIAESYKYQISHTENYSVTIASDKNIRSNAFTLTADRQNIQNVDMTAYDAQSHYQYSVYPNGLYYTKAERTSVLKPGNSAIVQVDVNPRYSYYDYLTMSVTGSPSINAVKLSYLQPLGQSTNFVESRYSSFSGGISVRDTQNLQKLYFLVWLNPNVAQDAQLNLTVRFFTDGSDQAFEYASLPLSVSYMAQPEVRVDKLIARGSSTQVQVEVNFDEELDTSKTQLQNNINIRLSTWNMAPDPITGRKIYTATITALIEADVVGSDNTNLFTLHVEIIRNDNGIIDRQIIDKELMLVNFVVDGSDMSISGAVENNFVAHVGISSPILFSYNLKPQNYTYDEGDSQQDAIVENLEMARKNLNETNFYLGSEQTNPQESIYYAINYDLNGQIPLKNRLFYRTSEGGWTNLYNQETGAFRSAGGYFTFGELKKGDDIIGISVLGERETTSPIEFRLDTYIKTGNGEGDIAQQSYFFTIESQQQSSEDLPLVVWNEEDFAALSDGQPQDYILMDDLVLENWTPFSTDAISSLDGNGHVIYINSFNTSVEGDRLRLALFDNVTEGTTLKNVRVNLYNGGRIIVDINRYKTVEIAGLALQNNGIITNCEVVSYYLDGFNSSRTSLETGLNIDYVSGAGNSSETIMNSGSDWESSVAGFVLENMGNITNSRVGGYTMTRLTGRGISDEIYSSVNQTLEEFNIIAQGNMAGFVLRNSGTIASSFAGRIAMNNKANDVDSYVSGFVGTNSGSVLSSYVEGDSGISEEGFASDAYCNVGSYITATLGKIAGFVYQNDNLVKNSYSNILISTNLDEKSIYLASGFVYRNNIDGKIENCYSASQVASSKYSQMSFTGTTVDGVALNYGVYTNNYYYCSPYYSLDQISTESNLNTGAIQLKVAGNEDYFYGFSFASDSRAVDGVWIMTDSGPRLVEPDTIAISHRRYVERTNPTGDDEKNYYLPYTMIDTADGIINTYYGSKYNPIIIRNAKEFNDVFGGSTDSDIKGVNFDAYSINGSYRLVDNIDLSELAISSDENFELASSSRAFTGMLMGNGFSISNLAISANLGTSNREFAFGMFASVEGGILLNFDLSITNVTNTRSSLVGAIAGFVRNSGSGSSKKTAKIVNISITYLDGATLEGGNFVGSVAGMVMGDSQIRNITVHNPNLTTKYLNLNESTEGNAIFSIRSANAWRGELDNILGTSVVTKIDSNYLLSLIDYLDEREYSYAGGVIGYADVYSTNSLLTSYRHIELKTQRDYPITSLRVEGDVNLRAQVVGGVIGYQGVSTYIMDAGLVIDGGAQANSHIVSTRYYAGGVIGQANSALRQIFAEHDAQTQNTIESNIATYYSGGNAERGVLDLFETGLPSENYSNIIAVGGLVGFASAGAIEIAYSKLNVISMNASYAGGVIGRIATQANATYHYSDGGEDFNTNYIFSEVYATGDVRAKGVEVDQVVYGTGGIVGQIESGSQVAMLSVNAFNEFSVYDYKTQTPYTEDQLTAVGDKVNLQFKYAGIYQIAGRVPADEKSALVFKQKKFDYVADSSIAHTDQVGYASVGYVSIYKDNPISTKELLSIPYYGFEEEISDDVTQTKSFKITNYTSITSIAVGQDITRGFFTTGSGTWSVENWDHTGNNLYPKIRYSLSDETYVWLDAYAESVRNVVTKVQQNPNIEIRVRGYLRDFNSAEQKYYSDIDWNGLLADIGQADRIFDNFAGKIVYSDEYLTNFGKETKAIQDSGIIADKPTLILSRPMFAVANSGFTLNNVSFAFAKTGRNDIKDDKGQSQNYLYADAPFGGAIVDLSITEGTIINTTLTIKDTVYLSGNSSENIGLVSGSMGSTKINGLAIYGSIEASGENSATILQTNSNKSSLNIGLISGNYSNTSAASIIRIEGLDIYNKNKNLIVVGDGGEYEDLNLGGCFGVATSGNEELEDTRDLSFKLGNIEGTDENNIRIDSKVQFKNLNLGGVVGKLGNNEDGDKIMSDLTNSFANKLQLNIQINSDTSTSENANIGLAVGAMYGSNSYSWSGKGGNDPDIVGHIYATKLANANIGGFVGYSASPLIISSVKEEVIMVANALDSSKISDLASEVIKDIDAADNMAINKIQLCGQSSVGGLVGKTTSNLTINGGTLEDNPLAINDNTYNPIAVAVSGGSSDTASVGGLVGSVEGTIQMPGFIKVQSLYSLGSSKTASTSSNPNMIYGGLIGSLKTGLGDSAIAQEEGGSIKAINKRIKSQVLVNATQAVIGGVIGQVSGENNLTVSQTAFGGAVKAYSGATFLTVGGTLGTIGGIGKTKLVDNVNYGDFFNISATTLSELTVAGVVAESSGIKEAELEASNNYSLMTNHNDIKIGTTSSSYTGDVYAVFGQSVAGKENALSENYYNHALSMATDSFATEVGYVTAYEKTDTLNTDTGAYTGYMGFGANKNKSRVLINDGSSMIGPEGNQINLAFLGEDCITQGTKFNPITISNDYANVITYDKFEGENLMSTNNITYYALEEDVKLKNDATLFALTNNDGSNIVTKADPYATGQLGGEFTYERDTQEALNLYIGLIGDSHTLTREVEPETGDDGSYQKLQPLIQTMNKGSFISGMLVQLKIDSENAVTAAQTEAANVALVGGVVNQMNGGKIYSVGVSGTLSIGGKGYATIGGFAGQIGGGHFEKSNISVDIVYRGANKTTTQRTVIGALAGSEKPAGELVWFADSFTAGSIYTYTNADVYAFAPITDAIIENAYTITRTQVTDITSEDGVISDENLVRKVLADGFNAAHIQNFAFNQLALEISDNTRGVTSYSALTDENADGITRFKQNMDYNYGYPTFDNHYANPTSFYSRGISLEYLSHPITADEISAGKEASADIARYQYSHVLSMTLSAANETDKKGYYFGVSSFDILEKLDANDGSFKNKAEAKQSVLLYELDRSLAYQPKANGQLDRSKMISIAGLKIDGNGKAIKNLTRTLFSDITGEALIENIRIVDAKVFDASALAESLGAGATVNYASAQGKIQLDDNAPSTTGVGGLINSLNGGTISNSTNLMIISMRDGGGKVTIETEVGGIVGTATGGVIDYCNNSATINVMGQAILGGILGAGTATIQNSYNAAGLAANYTADFTEKNGRYYVGGLVGKLGDGGNLIDCYNSGLVRGGTKRSMGMAYIGGLVGSLDGNIKNCINEGSVEGRSESTWSFRDYTEFIVMSQGDRHLAVTGIAYAGKAANIENSYITEDVQVEPNGNALPSDTILYQWNKTDEEREYDGAYHGGTTQINEGSNIPYHTYGMGFYSKSYEEYIPFSSSTGNSIIDTGWHFRQEEYVGYRPDETEGQFTTSYFSGYPAEFYDGDNLKSYHNKFSQVGSGELMYWAGSLINNKIEYPKSVLNTAIDTYTSNAQTGLLTLDEIGEEYCYDNASYNAANEYRNVDITSYDKYGFPKSIRFPYHIYQSYLALSSWLKLTGLSLDVKPENTELDEYHSLSQGFYYWTADYPTGGLGHYKTTSGEIVPVASDTISDKLKTNLYKDDSFAVIGAESENGKSYKIAQNSLRSQLNLSTNTEMDGDDQTILVGGESYRFTYDDVEDLLLLFNDAFCYEVDYTYSGDINISNLETDDLSFDYKGDLPIVGVYIDEHNKGSNNFKLKFYATREITDAEWNNLTFNFNISYTSQQTLDLSEIAYYISGDQSEVEIWLDSASTNDFKPNVKDGKIQAKLGENIIYLEYDGENKKLTYKAADNGDVPRGINDFAGKTLYYSVSEFATETFDATKDMERFKEHVGDDYLFRYNSYGKSLEIEKQNTIEEKTNQVTVSCDNIGQEQSVTVAATSQQQVKQYSNIEGRLDFSGLPEGQYTLSLIDQQIATIDVMADEKLINFDQPTFELELNSIKFVCSASVDGEGIILSITPDQDILQSTENDAFLSHLLDDFALVDNNSAPAEFSKSVTYDTTANSYINKFDLNLSGEFLKAGLVNKYGTPSLVVKNEGSSWQLVQRTVQINGNVYDAQLVGNTLSLSILSPDSESSRFVREIESMLTLVLQFKPIDSVHLLGLKQNEEVSSNSEDLLNLTYTENYIYSYNGGDITKNKMLITPVVEGNNLMLYYQAIPDYTFDGFTLTVGNREVSIEVPVQKDVVYSDLVVTHSASQIQMIKGKVTFSDNTGDSTYQYELVNGDSFTHSDTFTSATFNYDDLKKYFAINIGGGPDDANITHSYQYSFTNGAEGNIINYYITVDESGEEAMIYAYADNIGSNKLGFQLEQDRIEWSDKSGQTILTYDQNGYTRYYAKVKISDLKDKGLIDDSTDALIFDNDINIVDMIEMLNASDYIDEKYQYAYAVSTSEDSLTDFYIEYCGTDGSLQRVSAKDLDSMTFPIQNKSLDGSKKITLYYADSAAQVAKHPFVGLIEETNGANKIKTYFLFDYLTLEYDPTLVGSLDTDVAENYQSLFTVNVDKNEHEKTTEIIYTSDYASENPITIQELLSIGKPIQAFSKKDDSNIYVFVDDQMMFDGMTDPKLVISTVTTNWTNNLTLPKYTTEASLEFDIAIEENDLTVKLADGSSYNDYQIEGNKLRFTTRANQKVTATYDINITMAGQKPQQGKKPQLQDKTKDLYKGFLLTKDIDFGLIHSRIDFLETNFIGNDHTIKYIYDEASTQTASLFGGIGKEGQENEIYFRDVNIVGMRHNISKTHNNLSQPASLFVDKNMAKILNVNIYGSITNVDCTNKSANVGVVYENAGTLQNINANISINSTNGTASHPNNEAKISAYAYKMAGEYEELEFSGLLIAGDGYSAKDGKPGLSGMENFNIGFDTDNEIYSRYYEQNFLPLVRGQNYNNTWPLNNSGKDSIKLLGRASGASGDTAIDTYDSLIYCIDGGKTLQISAFGLNGEAAEKNGSGGSAYLLSVESVTSVDTEKLKVTGYAKAGKGGNEGHGGDGGDGADLYEFGSHQFYPTADEIDSYEEEYEKNHDEHYKELFNSYYSEVGGYFGDDKNKGPFHTLAEFMSKEFENRKDNTFAQNSPTLHYLSMLFKSSTPSYDLINSRTMFWNYDGTRMISSAKGVTFDPLEKYQTILDVGISFGNDYDYDPINTDSTKQKCNIKIRNNGGNGAAKSSSGAKVGQIYIAGDITADNETTYANKFEIGAIVRTATNGDGGRGGLGGVYLDQDIRKQPPGVKNENVMMIFKKGRDGVVYDTETSTDQNWYPVFVRLKNASGFFDDVKAACKNEDWWTTDEVKDIGGVMNYFYGEPNTIRGDINKKST